MRLRLTLWYTALLAASLVAFAVLSYAALARVIGRTVDESLEGAALAFSQSVAIEAGDLDMQGAAPDAIVVEAAREFQSADVTIIVCDRTGTMVARTGDGSSVVLAAMPEVRDLIGRALRDATEWLTLQNDGGTRLMASRRTLAAGEYVVVAVRSTAEQSAALAAVRRTYYLTVPIAVIVAALGGAWLARKSLAPVVAMAARAEGIRARTLDQRLPVSNPDDELGRLAVTFNDLLARLEASFDRQRRFMADASHELRTPLAVVCGEAEVALSQPDRPPAEYRESLAILLDEGKRLGRIVDELFLLARGDAGQIPLQRSTFALDELAGDTVLSVRSIAAAHDVTVTLESAGRMEISADEGLLGRMLLNLVDNAIRHSPPGTTVRVGLSTDADEYVLEVEDSGRGIPEAAQPFVFDRFYRAEAGRAGGSNGEGGAGLGLPIARWVAEAHGGKLVLKSSSAKGTLFEARLPRVARS